MHVLIWWFPYNTNWNQVTLAQVYAFCSVYIEKGMSHNQISCKDMAHGSISVANLITEHHMDEEIQFIQSQICFWHLEHWCKSSDSQFGVEQVF